MISDQIKTLVGIEREIGEPFSIEKGAIRKYAEAISDQNPLYVNEDYARKMGYSSILAPPTLICGLPPVLFLIPDMPEGVRGLHAGDEWEFFQPVLGGDTVYRKGKVMEVKDQAGKTGRMLFVTLEITFTNQRGEKVAVYRPTSMFRLKSEGR